MNEKKNYERAAMAVVAFEAKDIITTSGWTGTGSIVLPEDIFG